MVFAILVHTRINASVYRPTIGQIGRIYFSDFSKHLRKVHFRGAFNYPVGRGGDSVVFAEPNTMKSKDLVEIIDFRWFFTDPIASLEVEYLPDSGLCTKNSKKNIFFQE